jgi:hypothetical protein
VIIKKVASREPVSYLVDLNHVVPDFIQPPEPMSLWKDGEKITIEFVHIVFYDIGRQLRNRLNHLPWTKQSESQSCTNPGDKSTLLESKMIGQTISHYKILEKLDGSRC